MDDTKDIDLNKARRRFLRITGAGMVPLVAGCLGDSSSSNSSAANDKGPKSQNQPSQSEKSGGHLRVSVPESPETLNPLRYRTATAYVASRWIYSNLTQLSPSLEVKADVATDWSSNDDNTTWTFQLRDDVTFHDGSSLTAKDVAATFNTIYAEESGSPGKGLLGPIDSVNATKKHEAEFALTSPFASLPKALASQWARILPKSVLNKNTDELANTDHGSGPFELENFSTGDQVIVSRYDNYYKSDNNGNSLPYLSKITMKVQPEAITQVNSLSNQETDILHRVPAAQFNRVKNMQGTTALNRPGGWYYPINMRTTEAPFDDIRIRHAMKYGVDRKGILESARQNLGTLGQDNPITPVHEFYADLNSKFGDEANVKKAKQLLNKAGYKDGLQLDFPLYVSPDHNPAMGPTAVQFQSQMKKIGVDFKIQQISWDQYLSEVEAKETFYVTSIGVRSVESQALNVAVGKDGVYSGTMWHKTHPNAYEEYANALDEVETANDKKRAELLKKVQKIVRNKAGLIIPFYSARLGGQNNYVKNYKMDPTAFRVPLENTYLTDNAPK